MTRMEYGRYQVIKELGKGSMGIVYQAHDPNLDLKVALKVLRQDRLAADAFVKRFLAEAKALGRLDHPNIVRVYNVDEDKGTVYIAMEFIEGEPLDEVAKEKRFSPEEIIGLGITLAEALDYAHQKGIVHRDIKPSNILQRADGRIKITDFGIAHVDDPSASLQTQAGEILGTPAYMSPEQILGRPVDGRSDLFSLGVILYELSTGKRPFVGESLPAIFNAIAQEDPHEPTRINPSIPKALSHIIMKCLKKIPDERFDSGKALADALRESIKQREGEEARLPPSRQRRKRIILFLSIVIILTGAVGGLSYYFIVSKTETPPKIEVVKKASLKVESTPDGAQVFVDGMFKGMTPLTLGLPGGKHEIRLTLMNYHDWEAQVQLKEEGETPLQVRLIPMVEKKP